MGFAYQSLSSWQGVPVFESLRMRNNFYDGFSMCLRPQGGALSLGADYSKVLTDLERLPQARGLTEAPYSLLCPMQDPRFKWTEISEEQWYGVEINDIKVGNRSIGYSWYWLNWNGVIVDSGTTLLIVTPDILTAIQKQFLALCSTVKLPGVCNVPKNQDLFQKACIPLTQQQLQMFPTFSINFPGIGDLPIEPVDYLVRFCAHDRFTAVADP